MLDLNMSTVRSVNFSTSNPLNNIEHFDINLQNDDLSNLDGFSSSDKLYNKFLNDDAIEHYENLTHNELNYTQPEPTVVEQPEPTVVEQPEPTVVEQPEPAVVEQPEPAVVEQPEPAVVEQPEPAVVEQPANDSDLVGAPLENEVIKAEAIEQEEMDEDPVNITPRQTEGGGIGSIMTFSLVIYLLYYIMKFTRV